MIQELLVEDLFLSGVLSAINLLIIYTIIGQVLLQITETYSHTQLQYNNRVRCGIFMYLLSDHETTTSPEKKKDSP